MRLSLIHADEVCAAIDKPSGLVVHRSEQSADRRTCMTLLRDQLGRYVYPVHRLDRGASGVLVFGLDPAAARRLSESFADRRARKSYLALVRGWAPDAALVDRPLARESGGPVEPARTRFRCLARTELPFAVGRYATARYSLVVAEPETGRTHQIRRHLAGIAHPIVGDVNHGDSRHNRFFRDRFDAGRLLLHARRLVVPHPATGAPLVLEAPPSGSLGRLIARLGWEAALRDAADPDDSTGQTRVAGAAGAPGR